MRRPLSLAAAAAVLLAGTVALSAIPTAVPTGPDRVADPGDGAWRLRGDRGGVAELRDGVLHLHSEAGQRAVAWTDVRLADERFRWRVRAHVRAPKPASVQIVLAAQEGTRAIWVGSYRFESDEWTDVDLPVTADLRGMDVQVGVLLRGEAGHAEVTRVDLEPMQWRPAWTVAVGALAVGWLVWGGLLLWEAGWAAMAVAATIAVGVTLPRTWLDPILGQLVGVRFAGESVAFLLQKLFGHAGLFAVLGFAIARRWGPWQALGAVVVLGGATEALQLVAVARSASLSDVALDAAGGATGVLLAWLWWSWRSRRAASPN